MKTIPSVLSDLIFGMAVFSLVFFCQDYLTWGRFPSTPEQGKTLLAYSFIVGAAFALRHRIGSLWKRRA